MISKDEERTFALDPDVVIAVQFVSHLRHVPDDGRVGSTALARSDRLDGDRLVLAWWDRSGARVEYPLRPERG